MARIGSQAQIGFKKQTTYTGYVTPDLFYRANSENLLPKYDFVQDDTLINNQLPATKWVVGQMVEGALPGPLFPDQLGYNMISVLGGESAVSDPAVAYLLISYNGASPYARLTKATDTITAELSANGSSWSADTNFNTSGAIDVTASGFDTLTEIQAAVAGYTGWDCILMGAGTTASAKIADFTATNLMTNDVNQGAYLLKAVDTTSTTTKTHNLTPAASTAELPAFSFIVNRGIGTNKSLAFTGMSAKTLALEASAKDTVKSNWSLTGRSEAVDTNDVSLTPATTVPYKTANMKVIIEDASGNLTELTELKTCNLTIDPAIDDNRVIGDLSPAQPSRQQGKFDLAITANATTTQYALISNYKANTVVKLYIYCKTDEYADTANVVPYSYFIRIPNFMFSEFASPTSNKDRYVIDMPGSVYKSSSTIYPTNFYCYIVDAMTSTY